MSQIILSKVGLLNKSLPINLSKIILIAGNNNTSNNGQQCLMSCNQTNNFSTNILIKNENNKEFKSNQQSQVLNFQQRRNIFDDSFLGLDKLYSLRRSIMNSFDGSQERYIERLKGFIDADDFNSIILDDLINMIAFAQNSDHIDIIDNISALFAKNNLNHNWGSAVMRLYYVQNEIDRAYKNIMDVDKFKNFFSQYSSYQIVLTMLFNAGRYEEVLNVHQQALNQLEQIQTGYDRKLALSAIAACVKLNTSESLKRANEIYLANPSNRTLRTRIVSLLSYLHMSQKEYAIALNLLADGQIKQSNQTIRSIKLLSLMKLNRGEDMIGFLRLTVKNSDRGFILIHKDVFDQVRSMQINDEESKDQLEELLSGLEKEQLVSDKTLEEDLFRKVTYSAEPRRQEGMRDRPQYGYYNKRDRNGGDSEMGGDAGRDLGRNMNGNTNDRQAYGYRQTRREGMNNYNRNYNNNQYREGGRRNNQNAQREPKSYFEDDLDLDDLEETTRGDKRFR